MLTGEKQTQGDKGLSCQIGLEAHIPGIWLSILTKCCPERPKRGEMYLISSVTHIFGVVFKVY